MDMWKDSHEGFVWQILTVWSRVIKDCVIITVYWQAHQGVHLFRQAKNYAELCDFRIRTEIHNFRNNIRQLTIIENFGTIFSKLAKVNSLVRLSVSR